MDKVKKVGKLPVNSRILIDYTGKKPKIKFAYPRKDSFRQNFASTPILLITPILYLIIILILINVISVFGEMQSSPSNCSVVFHERNYTYLEKINFYTPNFTISCDNYNSTFNWNYGKKFIIKNVDYSNIAEEIFPQFISPRFSSDNDLSLKEGLIASAFLIITPIMIIMSFILLLCLVTLFFTKTKFGISKVPYLNKVTSGKGYYVCYRNIKTDTIEIPLFENIFLDYKATKDFSKYLQRVVILEHPFSKIVRQGKKRKKLRNIHYWLCQFQLSKVPRQGKLEVWFK